MFIIYGPRQPVDLTYSTKFNEKCKNCSLQKNKNKYFHELLYINKKIYKLQILNNFKIKRIHYTDIYRSKLICTPRTDITFPLTVNKEQKKEHGIRYLIYSRTCIKIVEELNNIFFFGEKQS